MEERSFMGISTIGSLFASNIDSMSKQQSAGKQDARSQATQSVQQDAKSTDAVIFTRSGASAQQATSTSDSARASRVQQLKTQVQSGSYRADSEKVAVAVLKELA
jgi:flagellar biosynthesis anti-sigma factor FlgM